MPSEQTTVTYLAEPYQEQRSSGSGAAVRHCRKRSSAGVQPPIPTWGNMLQAAQAGLLGQPGKVFYPGMAIFLASLAFNYMGDGMREALDARLNS